VTRNLYVVLRWYVADDVLARLLPAGVKRADIAAKVPAEQYPAIYQSAMNMIKLLQFDSDAEDRSEYQRYIERAQARLKLIGP